MLTVSEKFLSYKMYKQVGGITEEYLRLYRALWHEPSVVGSRPFARAHATTNEPALTKLTPSFPERVQRAGRRHRGEELPAPVRGHFKNQEGLAEEHLRHGRGQMSRVRTAG